MQLIPDLRPSGPKLERAGDVPRERNGFDGADSRARFDEQLQEVAERREPARESRAHETRESTGEGRERTAAEPSAARSGKPSEQASGAADERASAERSPSEPTKDAKIQTATSHMKADGSKLTAESCEETSLQTPLEPTLPQLEQATSAEVAPGMQAGGPPASAGSQPQDSLAATLFSLAQLKVQQPAAPAAGPAVIGTQITAAVEGDSASEPAAASVLPDADAPQSVLPLGGDESARAGVARSEALPSFEGELARLREVGTPVAPAPLRSHQEQAAEILRQVRVGLSADLREASIQLAPEALGRVTIRLRVEDGVLSADVHAQTPEALRALQHHAPELKAALAGNGMQASHLEFHLGSAPGHTGDGANRGSASHARPARNFVNHLVSHPAALERALTRGLSASGIDTFA